MHPLLEDTRRLLDEAVAGLDDEAAARRLAENRWTVAEIVEHLTLAYEYTVKGLGKVGASGPWGQALKLHQRLFKAVILHAEYFPTGARAPKHVVPQGAPLSVLVVRAHAALAAMDAALDDTGRAHGERTCVMPHPILGGFSVHDWRRFHRVHTRHHARQIAARRQGRL